jgi:PEGA domain
MKPATRIASFLVLLAALSYANDHQRPWQSAALLDVTTAAYALPPSQPAAGQIDTGDVSLSQKHFAMRFNASSYSLESGDFIWVATRAGRYGDFQVAFHQPMKFAVENSNLYLIDAEGKERKLRLQNKVAKAGVLRSGPLLPAAAEPGKIVLESDPESAAITLDGRRVGTTPAVIRLLPGTHDLRLSLDGWKSWSATINVQEGADLKIPVNLEKDRK